MMFDCLFEGIKQLSDFLDRVNGTGYKKNEEQTVDFKYGKRKMKVAPLHLCRLSTYIDSLLVYFYRRCLGGFIFFIENTN